MLLRALLILLMTLMAAPVFAQSYPNKAACDANLVPLYLYKGNVLPTFEATGTAGMDLGFGSRFGSAMSIGTDASATFDPSSILRWTYFQGLAAGGGGGQLNFWGTTNPKVPTNTYYEALEFRVIGNGTNFEHPGVGPWKILGFWGVGDPIDGYNGGLYSLVEAGNNLGTSPGTNHQLASVFNFGMVRQSPDNSLGGQRINAGSFTLLKRYRVEFCFKINDLPPVGQPPIANGVMKVWITNLTDAGSAQLVINVSNFKYRNNAYPTAFKSRHFNLTWGGGSPYAKTRNDVLEFTHIAGFGLSGGGGGSADTTSPLAPTSPTAVLQPDGTSALTGWGVSVDAGANASGMAGHQVLRCTVVNPATTCVPTTVIFSPTATATSYLNTGLAVGKHGYCFKGTDIAGNPPSACSSPVVYVTVVAPPPPPEPSIASITNLTASSFCVNFGAVVPTEVRIDFGDNGGLFHGVIPGGNVRPISDFPSCVFTLALPGGTNYLGAHPINASGVENTNPNDSKYIGTSTINPPNGPISASFDTAAVVFGTAFPATNLAAGTTSIQFGVPIDNKAGVVACRWHTSDIGYTEMPSANEMAVANLIASATKDPLVEGANQLYVNCAFTNVLNDVYENTTSKSIVITVDASTPDPTPPAKVASVTPVAIPNSSDFNVTWATIPGVSGYQVETSTDGVSFTVAGNPTLSALFITTSSPNTLHYVKVHAIGTNGVSGEDSDVAQVTTLSVPDNTPPPQVTGFRSIGQLAATALFTWDFQLDSPIGPVRTRLEFCQGPGCTNFEARGGLISSTQALQALSPNTFYRVRAIHIDDAGNPSCGVDSPCYSDPIVEIVTSSSGLDLGRSKPTVERGQADRGDAGTRSVRP